MFANTMRSVSAACLIGGALAGSSLPAAAQDAAEATTETAAPAQKQGLQAGSLVCKGDGGWGAIITSRKSFKCIFTAPNGQTVGTHDGVITKIGLDLGKTGQSVLTWLVLGPAAKVGENFEPGSLAGIMLASVRKPPLASAAASTRWWVAEHNLSRSSLSAYRSKPVFRLPPAFSS